MLPLLTSESAAAESGTLSSGNAEQAASGTPAETEAAVAGVTAATDQLSSDSATSSEAPGQSPAQNPLQGLQAAAALPRMPMGLAYVGSRRAYAALATAMRMTGRLTASGTAGVCPLYHFLCLFSHRSLPRVEEIGSLN